VFATQAISCAPREAGYVLDGLLENDTLVRPQVHTTDTHGFTEQLFGLCHLLGIAFMPRLKDLPDQHLYKLDKGADHGALAACRFLVQVAQDEDRLAGTSQGGQRLRDPVGGRRGVGASGKPGAVHSAGERH